MAGNSKNVTEEPPAEELFEGSRSCYFDCICLYGAVAEDIREAGFADASELKPVIEQIVEILQKDQRMLLGLANAPYSYIHRQLEQETSPQLTAHAVNVMIYSLKMAIALGVPDARVPYIAFAALFHNLGLVNAPESFFSTTDTKEFRLKAGEYESGSAGLIENITVEGLHSESIIHLIRLIEEDREALTRTNLQEVMYQYAMLIHVCNEFETLTHFKGGKDVYSPVEAMKKMRSEMKDYFHPDIIKLFFNKLSIYPLGSFVKLSSSEIAKIVQINENFIMRPVVMIVIDHEGREKAEPVHINLREKPNLYIKKAIVDEHITEKFIDVF